MYKACATCYLWVGVSHDNLVLHPTRGYWLVPMEEITSNPEWMEPIYSIIYEELPWAARVDITCPDGRSRSVYFERGC